MSPAKARRGSLVAQTRAVGGIKIAVVSTKGGPGKSTIAWNTAHECAQRGARTLLINTDNLRTVLDAAAVRTIPDRVRVIDYPHISIWEDLERLSEGFDVTVIDGHGRHDRMTRAVIAATAAKRANSEDNHGVLLIPVEVGAENFWPLRRDMVPILLEARRAYGPVRARMVLNNFAEREVITQITRETLLDTSGSTKEQPALIELAPMAAAEIERHTVYRNAIGAGMAVCEYEPRGAATRDIAALATEAIKLALSEP